MKKGFFIITTLAFLLINCKKDNLQQNEFPNPPDGLNHWPVLNVIGPGTGLINEPLIIEVTYPTSSGCDYVSEFQTVFSNNTVLVKAFGTSLKDSPCTFEAVPKKINFSYIPNTKGNYTFKFINPDNSLISISLIIN